MSGIIKLNDFPLNPVQDQVYEIIPDKAKIVASTNRLFNKYPTRYISAVPRFAINRYSEPSDYVIDPFCGSGTSAIEAMLLGRNAISVDIDPFARLLIKVKTTVYTDADLAYLADTIEAIRASDPDPNAEYPRPQMQNLEKWFTEDAMTKLSFLKYQIDTLAKENRAIHDYLYVVLAAIIRKASNAENVSPKPYISTRYPKTPEDAVELFFKAEGLYRPAITEFSRAVAPLNVTSTILPANDARDIEADHPIDLAVTSPPYINAYDYVRSLKFEDIWLGLADERQLRENRRSYIGTELSNSFYAEHRYAVQSDTLLSVAGKIKELDRKRAGIVMTYFEDMARNMAAIRDALKAGGHYVIVVGDSTIKGQKIPTARILAEIAAQNGYSFDLSFLYVIRDRYLHLPRGGKGGIIKFDEILCLKKNGQ